jgi:hypothetical protein
MATLAHLWTKAPAPPDFIELWLCTQVYHCVPSALDEQDAETILRHMTILAAEGQVAKQREANAR